MTGVSFFTRFANGTILVNIKYMTRFWLATGFGLSAFLIISLASYQGTKDEVEQSWFYVAIFASVLIGLSSAMGESTFLAFCNKFPSHVVGYVSSGTGCAGLTGSGTVLLLHSIGLENY